MGAIAGSQKASSTSVLAFDEKTAPLPSAKLWMRPISFCSLHHITSDLYEMRPEGLTASDLNRLILEKGIVVSQRRAPPSITTLYHYRNTLLRLGILGRTGRLLRLAADNALVRELTGEESQHRALSLRAREIYRELVFANNDCRHVFLDLFMPIGEHYGLSEFFQRSSYVVWREMSHQRRRSISMLNPTTGKGILLTTASEIQALLYGMRYWGRNELLFLDEFFREDMGAILYPVKEVTAEDETVVRDAIRDRIDSSAEWTTLAVRDLAYELCVARRWTLTLLFAAIKSLVRLQPGHVALIATSRGFASIGARSLQREEFELRGYLRDVQGRVISHVRLHRDLRRGLSG